MSEPLGWVYGAASVTWMANAQDQSWQLTPELSYAGFNGWDLRGRLSWLQGAQWSEFGAKGLRASWNSGTLQLLMENIG